MIQYSFIFIIIFIGISFTYASDFSNASDEPNSDASLLNCAFDDGYLTDVENAYEDANNARKLEVAVRRAKFLLSQPLDPKNVRCSVCPENLETSPRVMDPLPILDNTKIGVKIAETQYYSPRTNKEHDKHRSKKKAEKAKKVTGF